MFLKDVLQIKELKGSGGIVRVNSLVYSLGPGVILLILDKSFHLIGHQDSSSIK